MNLLSKAGVSVISSLVKKIDYSNIISQKEMNLLNSVPVFSKISHLSIQDSSNNSTAGKSIFHNAKVVKLRSYQGKYLYADDNQESVILSENGSSRNTEWTVEFASESNSIIRLKSCHNKYLAASDKNFLEVINLTGRKIIQTLPRTPDASDEWEPVRDGKSVVRLKSVHGDRLLRANNELVSHKVPSGVSPEKYEWQVDVVEKLVQSPVDESPSHTSLSESSSENSNISSEPKVEVDEQSILSWTKDKGMLLMLLLLVLILILLIFLTCSIVVVLVLVFGSQINELIKSKCRKIVTNVKETVLKHKHKLKMLCVCVIVYLVARLAFYLRF